MLLRHFICAALAVILSWVPVSLLAQDTSREFGDLVKQLDSDKFAERQTASQKLAEAGKAAAPALAEAAQSESREASTRAVEILKNQFQKGDLATKTAAKEALGKIVKGTNSAAARRADEALNPKPEIQLQEAPLRPGIIRLNPGQIQIQVQANPGGAVFRRTNVKITNGVKEIDIDDNGKKVKILDDPNNGIKVEVTQKNKDGKEETKKYEAKNADELKKNSPDGHKIYEEYSKQQNGVQIRAMIPGALPPGALPPGVLPPGALPPGVLPPGALPPGLLPPGFPRFEPPALPVLPAPPRIRPAPENAQKERIEAARERLDKAEELLKRLAQTNANPDLIKQLGESLETAKKQLEEAKAKGAE